MARSSGGLSARVKCGSSACCSSTCGSTAATSSARARLPGRRVARRRSPRAARVPGPSRTRRAASVGVRSVHPRRPLSTPGSMQLVVEAHRHLGQERRDAWRGPPCRAGARRLPGSVAQSLRPPSAAGRRSGAGAARGSAGAARAARGRFGRRAARSSSRTPSRLSRASRDSSLSRPSAPPARS